MSAPEYGSPEDPHVKAKTDAWNAYNAALRRRRTGYTLGIYWALTGFACLIVSIWVPDNLANRFAATAVCFGIGALLLVIISATVLGDRVLEARSDLRRLGGNP